MIVAKLHCVLQLKKDILGISQVGRRKERMRVGKLNLNLFQKPVPIIMYPYK